ISFDGDAPRIGDMLFHGEGDVPVVRYYEGCLGWSYPLWEGHKTQLREPPIDSAVPIYHTLNLADDISINYAVPVSALEAYDRIYMTVQMPRYEGNTRVGHEILSLLPVRSGNYYYFTLDGLTAIRMNDEPVARVYMTKAGESLLYASNEDRYSIATYAYNQLNTAAAPHRLKVLCANLLQYGAKAQIYKHYRTDATVDGNMTRAHKAYLTDLSTMTYGNTNRTLNDLAVPGVTWSGKTLDLQSKVVLRYIVDLTGYTGRLADLKVVVAYTNIHGEKIVTELTDPTPYGKGGSQFAFDFAELRASDLRCTLTAQVMDGTTPVSRTLLYSVDTYCKGKPGDLGVLCNALLAYSDAARAFFASHAST
ncbi:MAG: hypothetical protein IKM59_06960, partial [Oscillospiraceae bacterium]|nr:hypothetical protein [Oscillospiraceae bacterium]